MIIKNEGQGYLIIIFFFLEVQGRVSSLSLAGEKPVI